VKNSNHPNNIYIEAIKPENNRCRVCGAELVTRSDDQDEKTINMRHKIYYDTETGTLAAAYYFKQLAEKEGKIQYITLDGRPSVKQVSHQLMSELERLSKKS